MPTYAQLQSESWWTREIVTPELDWLGDELCRRTKRPRGAFGVKGDNKHLRGSHRSQEWILKSKYATSRTYTVQSGLTATQQRHLCGVDFVPGEWGSAASERLMKAQTGRLIAAMKAGQLNEVREVFGTTNGRTVTGYNNVTNQPATSDDSHLEHWHLTLDRRHCANKRLMERILAIALGEDDDMPSPQEVADAVWKVGAKEYVDQDGNKIRDTRLALDILYSTHAAAVTGAAQVTALTAVVEQMAEVIRSGGGSVDTVAILAGVDQRVTRLESDIRDAVADLGEGGAVKVRAG